MTSRWHPFAAKSQCFSHIW